MFKGCPLELNQKCITSDKVEKICGLQQVSKGWTREKAQVKASCFPLEARILKKKGG